MLQALGFVVDFIPGKIEHVVKETFQQAMVAQNFQGSALSEFGEADTVMLFVLHKGRALVG